MTQLAEQFGTPSVHAESENCPFCNEEKTTNYKTFKGSKNNSRKLATIMEDPGKLTSLQPNAKPKPKAPKKPKPDPVHENSAYGAYSCQAHHIISGNEIMDGEPIEDWIKSAKQIKSDTGYSINNSDNGVWLVSKPLKHPWPKGGDPLTMDKKLAIARLPMLEKNMQWHLGPHGIEDPSDKYYKSYPRYGKDVLRELNIYVSLWSEKCGMCKEKDQPKKPFPPPFKVNNYLDFVSKRIEMELVGKHPRNWKFCISKVALMLHKEFGGGGKAARKMKRKG